MPSPAQVAQQAVRPQQPAPQPQRPAASAPAAQPAAAKEGAGMGRFVWIFVVLGLVVAGGIAAGSVLSSIDTVVVVEEQEAMPEWMPYAVAGGVVLAGLIALMLGGLRPELALSWAGLALVTYGSGLGLERIEEITTSQAAAEVLTQLDSTESLILAGAGLVLLGQLLAIRRFFRPRPIAAVRALLGTGFLSALAIAVALTSILHAGVEVGGG
jgi:hypothetical protein